MACDQAYEDMRKPPEQRRAPVHILLLGQGGGGKTHVVQRLVFEAVAFIWPAANALEPTLMVVAASNAQAKNISTADHKARTIHNASCMRVQSYAIKDMKPGSKQDALAKLWSNVVVLVMEEVLRRNEHGATLGTGGEAIACLALLFRHHRRASLFPCSFRRGEHGGCFVV